MLERMREKKQISIALDYLYIFAMIILVIYAFLETTMFQIEWPGNFYIHLRDIVTILVLLRMTYSQWYTKKELALSALTLMIFLFSWRENQAEVIITMLILIIGAKGFSFQKLLSVYTVTKIILLAITVISALTGRIENLVYHWEGRNVRIAFGICYPTDFAAQVFFIVLCCLYLRKDVLKYIDIILTGIVAMFLYLACEARWTGLCLILTIGMLIYYKFSSERSKKRGKIYMMPAWLSGLLAISPVLCASFMTLFSMVFDQSNSFLVLMNRLVNQRFYNAKRAVDVYGFSLWGKYIPMQGNGGTTQENKFYFFLDSSYMSIALQYGIILLGMVLFIWIIISFRARAEKNWMLLFVISLTCVQCMVEHHMLEIAYNPFLWALFANTMSKERFFTPVKQRMKTRRRKAA